MALNTVSLTIVLVFATGIYALSKDLSRNSEHEKQALKQFRSAFNASYLYRDYMHRDEFLLRWILDADFNVEKARDKLMRTLKWRQENAIDTILDREDLSSSEKFCPYNFEGRDRVGRPVVVSSLGSCSARKALFGRSVEQLRQMMLYASEATATLIRLFQEQDPSLMDLVLIADLSSANPREHNCPKCITLIPEGYQISETYYPEYIAHIFVVNVPRVAVNWFVSTAPLLPEKARKKIHVFGFDRKEWQTEIFKYVDPSQLEHRFGGTKPPSKFVPFKVLLQSLRSSASLSKNSTIASSKV